MKKAKTILISIMILLLVFAVTRGDLAYGTASTHIWAPSTDTQPFGTGHGTADVYIPVERNQDGSRPNTITNTGLTFGLLPFKKLTAEAGFDYKTGYGSLDSYPIYFNAKLAAPEGSLAGYIPYGEFSPAVAGGIYDVGTEVDKTDDNIVYVKTAKTINIKDFLPGATNIKDLSLGRFSIGYFWGNDKLLLNQDLEKDAHGILLAWERTMLEISDKLWVCAEYQGSKSAYGALNVGFSWQFTPSTSVIVGYQFYNNRSLADTATIQVDINF
jgi:hypothetical protein